MGRIKVSEESDGAVSVTVVHTNDVEAFEVSDSFLTVGANEVVDRPKIILPPKKRKPENNIVMKKRLKNADVSQRQCKLDFPPCKVCLGKGSGLHYGVNSCESCKSFFRRCLTRKEEYKCTKGWSCEVTSQVRGNCSGCRYMRCLNVGMSREAACLGRYTLSRRTKTIMEAKGETHSDGIKALSPISPIDLKDKNIALKSENSSPQSEFLEDVDLSPSRVEAQMMTQIDSSFDIELLKRLVEAMAQIKPFNNIVTEEQIVEKLKEGYESYKAKAQVFGKMTAIPRDEYFSLLDSTGIDIDGRQEFLRQSALSIQPVLHSYIAFANIVPGFQTLSLSDQCNLLKTSHFEFILLLTYRGYDADLQMILTETGKAYHIDQAADIFFSRALIHSIFDVCKKIQGLEMSREETSFLLSVALTFVDRCELEEAGKVEEVQMEMIRMMRAYLVHSRGAEASLWFTKAVDCFIAMRAVGDLYTKEYSVICQDKMVQKEAPIWLALI